MTVDQADDIAAPAAAGGVRPRHAAALQHRPDAPPAAPGPNTATGPAAAEPGLAGLWPVPHTGTPRMARRVFSADITTPRSAREFTRATLRDWGTAEDADAAEDVVIAVSELATNALQHGMEGLPRPLPPRPIQLVLIGHPRRLLVSVTDPGGRPPEPAGGDPDRFVEGGRGLLVVGAVSDAWGWARLATGGKAVWAAFELRVSPPSPRSDEPAPNAPDAPAR